MIIVAKTTLLTQYRHIFFLQPDSAISPHMTTKLSHCMNIKYKKFWYIAVQKRHHYGELTHCCLIVGVQRHWMSVCTTFFVKKRISAVWSEAVKLTRDSRAYLPSCNLRIFWQQETSEFARDVISERLSYRRRWTLKGDDIPLDFSASNLKSLALI